MTVNKIIIINELSVFDILFPKICLYDMFAFIKYANMYIMKKLINIFSVNTDAR